jgi:hypothetical protein
MLFFRLSLQASERRTRKLSELEPRVRVLRILGQMLRRALDFSKG